MKLKKRARKIFEFLSPELLEPETRHPWPWTLPSIPTHVATPVSDIDGHGGYTRSCLFDERDIPYTPDGPRRLYDPLVVARYALKLLAVSHAFGSTDAARRAANLLPLLLASSEPTGCWGRASDPGRMTSTRPSAMVQGVVVSAILRLSAGRTDGSAHAAVERGLERMLTPVERGGSLSELRGGPFLEESLSDPPSHILNGGLYALFALYDLCDALAHPRATSMAAEIEGTLRRTLSDFTTRSGWSRYALDLYGRRPIASAYYHVTHISQILIVAERTGDPVFRAAAAQWMRALHSTPVRIRAAATKIGQAFWMRHILRLPLREA